MTNRTGGVSTMRYNYRGQVASTTDPNSIQTGYYYNNRNWLQSVTRNSKTMSVEEFVGSTIQLIDATGDHVGNSTTGSYWFDIWFGVNR